LAQDNAVAKEMAIKIADRIVASTVYEFKDVKTGKVYTSLDNVSLNPDMRVNSKYFNWHYTNGVTNMALMELGDKIQNRKYEDYVLKNMKFIFDKTNQSYFHRLYDKTFREGGWRAVPRLTWHMIYRNKRLDDNGPMGASLITLNQRHPDDAFQKYIETTNHHIMVSEPRLADGTIARLWPHENTIWADDAFMAVSFISRMGEVTGEKKYFDDAANQILNYTRYLWCPEKQIYYHCYHTDNKEHGVAHWSRANGWIFMATADLLARMPENHPMREDVIKNFQMQASGVARYQGKNGLWHQLLDKEDSYEEITGSSMFVFGIAKGVKEGWLHPDFIYVAWQGFKGMLSKISENGDVTAICVGTGIMPSTVFYYNRPTQENDSLLYHCRLGIYVCFLAQMIHLGPHRQRISFFICNTHIHRQTIIMQPSSPGRIGYIYILGSTFYHIPHFLLHGHGTGGIINNQRITGIQLFQPLLRLQQGFGSLGMKIGLLQILIKDFPGKIVGTGIHQIYFQCRVHPAYIHQSQRIKIMLHPALRESGTEHYQQ
jgi:unsaturated rhamnogalacturonyl hydrolase